MRDKDTGYSLFPVLYNGDLTPALLSYGDDEMNIKFVKHVQYAVNDGESF